MQEKKKTSELRRDEDKSQRDGKREKIKTMREKKCILDGAKEWVKGT